MNQPQKNIFRTAGAILLLMALIPPWKPIRLWEDPRSLPPDTRVSYQPANSLLPGSYGFIFRPPLTMILKQEITATTAKAEKTAPQIIETRYPMTLNMSLLNLQWVLVFILATILSVYHKSRDESAGADNNALSLKRVIGLLCITGGGLWLGNLAVLLTAGFFANLARMGAFSAGARADYLGEQLLLGLLALPSLGLVAAGFYLLRSSFQPRPPDQGRFVLSAAASPKVVAVGVLGTLIFFSTGWILASFIAPLFGAGDNAFIIATVTGILAGLAGLLGAMTVARR